MTARQFGRDSGDTYGRHALVNPGGDNTQRDVLHVVDLGELYARGFRIHPSRIDPAYVGAHRPDGTGTLMGGMVCYSGRYVLVRPDGTSTAPAVNR